MGRKADNKAGLQERRVLTTSSKATGMKQTTKRCNRGKQQASGATLVHLQEHSAQYQKSA